MKRSSGGNKELKIFFWKYNEIFVPILYIAINHFFEAEKEKAKTAKEEAACMELAERCKEDLKAAEIPLKKAEDSLAK